MVRSSDRYAVISWEVAGVVLQHPVVAVGRRSKVGRLVAAVNRLSTVAPGTVVCDLTRGDVTVSFHRSRRAPANATVREQLGCNSVVVRTSSEVLELAPGHLIRLLSKMSGLNPGQIN
jgi:hypothetical protein